MNAVHYLESLKGVDSSRIGVVGLSMGGGVAVKISLMLENVEALVLLAPALHFPQLMKRDEVKPVNGYVYMGAHRLKVDNALELAGFTVIESAPKIKAPTLIIHAVDDGVVPINQSRRFYKDLRVEKRFVELSGGHVFNDYKARERLITEVRNWFISHIPLE